MPVPPYSASTIAAAIDGVGEGLAHALVLELLHLVVEGDVAGGVGRAQQDLKIGVALHHRHVVGIETLHAVDLTRLERAQPLRVVLDVAHDHALDLGLHAPVVGVRLQHDFLVGLPLDELVGPGAHRMLAELRAPLLHGGRARDVEGEHGQVGQERRLRILERDAHRVRAGGLDLGHDRLVVEAAELPLPVLEGLPGLDLVVVLRMRGLPPALEVPHHRLGVEGRAVVKLHVAAQRERPHLAVGRDFPRLGQRRLHLGGGALVLHQAVVDLARDAPGDAVGDDGGIELHRLALRAEHERLARWPRPPST